MKPADVLNCAADLIDLRGHCKGVYVDERRRMCAMGSIAEAASWKQHLMVTPMNAFAAFLGGNDLCILDWNDEPKRTKAEVTSALRAAAALLTMRESVAGVAAVATPVAA